MAERDKYKLAADVLFDYLRDIIYNTSEASLDITELPEPFVDFGKGLIYLHKNLSEARKFSTELAKGNLDSEIPSADNEIAAPLKDLHASLRHLSWQAQTVAKGNYNQHVEFMGEFAEAFSNMIEQLKQREADSLAEKKRLRSFLAKTSHEVRNPLNTILGMAQLSLREEMAPAARGYINIIKQAGSHLLSIVDDVLDFSKIESGRMEIVPEQYLLSDLFGAVINMIKIRVMGSRLSFETHLDESLPNELYGDSMRLRQIMLNLLSNAFKYTDEGFVRFSISGEVVGENDIVLIITVSDSGRGIKSNHLSTIFEEFSQVDLQNNRDIEGTGLGLSITKGLATAMGGEVLVMSEYGRGSTFTVNIPQKIRGNKKVALADEQSIVSSISNADYGYAISFAAPRARLLVVDDVATNLMVAKGLMKPYGVKVEVCSDGAQAVQMIADAGEAGRFDLIFMDDVMGGINGVEAVSQIRQMDDPYFRQVPIIALTANVISGAKDNYIENGFNGFLPKPIDPAELDDVLCKWMPKDKQEPVQTGIVQKIDHGADKPDHSIRLLIERSGFIDAEKGIVISGGTLGQYLQTLSIFHKETLESAHTAENAYQNADLPAYIGCMHSLGSALGGIGAIGLSQTAQELQAAGREGNLGFIRANGRVFLEHLDELLEQIGIILAVKDAEPADIQTLRSELVVLREAMQCYDIAAINQSTVKLKSYLLEPEVGSTIEEILQCKLIGAYDSARSIIDELLTEHA